MEHGEMDLNQKLQQLQKADEIDENFLRITWQQMLKAVDAIHQNRIVHGKSGCDILNDCSINCFSFRGGFSSLFVGRHQAT